MSAQSSPVHQDEDTPLPSDSPGRQLRLTRQARGMAIDRVAGELHLAPDQIIALENDDYDALPGAVFVIGYMRNYARFLNIDPEPLVDVYRETQPQPHLPKSKKRPTASRQVGSGHLLVRLVTIAILIGAGWLAFSWWQTQYPDTMTADPVQQDTTEDLAATTRAPTDYISTPGGSASPADTPPETDRIATPAEPPVAPLEPIAGSVPTQPQAGEAPPPDRSVPTSTADRAPAQVSSTEQETTVDSAPATVDPAGVAAPPEGPEAVAPAGQADIVVTFSGPCWVDIRDSERKFKLFGEMGKGDRHLLEGKPPYSMILGNAAAVTISVAGAPFNLEAVTRGNVARFTLDPARLP